MKAVLVFLAVAALDVVWTLYIKATAEHRRTAAASWAALIIGVSGFAATEYVQDPKLLVPAAAGAWVGTWLAFYLKREKPHGVYAISPKGVVVKVLGRALRRPTEKETPGRGAP